MAKKKNYSMTVEGKMLWGLASVTGNDAFIRMWVERCVKYHFGK